MRNDVASSSLLDTLSLLSAYRDHAAVRYPSSHATELLSGLSDAVMDGG